MIGQTIGNITVTEKLGAGGMGEVYKGVDCLLEREVAVKVLLPTMGNQSSIVERFRQEAVTLARLQHPNITTLYGFVRHQNQKDYCMIMEYVQGLRLDQIITRVGPLPFQYAAQLIVQALDGLEHAHKYSVVHRDIKPSNLMITPECRVKIMDFGLARALWTSNLTQQGTIIGTFEYMSPEQIRGLEVDARSDLYSLGIVFYEILTGKVPFQARSEYDLMRLHVENAPPSLRELCGDIPLEIEEIVLQSLSKDPAGRFNSPADFREKLMPYLATQSELIKFLGPTITDELGIRSSQITDLITKPKNVSQNIEPPKRPVNYLHLIVAIMLLTATALSFVAYKIREKKTQTLKDTNSSNNIVVGPTPVITPEGLVTNSVPGPTPRNEQEVDLVELWKKYCESCDDSQMPPYPPEGLTLEMARKMYCKNISRCRKGVNKDRVKDLIKEL